MINKYIGQYNKKNKGSINLYDINSKEIEDDFFDLLMAEDDTLREMMPRWISRGIAKEEDV